LDLTSSTGGSRFNPPRNSLPNSFQPFSNNLLPITFTLSQASEVLAFIGLFNTDTRFTTLLDRIPLGSGSHTIFWDGLDSSGVVAVPPAGDSFLFGIFGFALPANAIYIAAAPAISNVTVTPNFFDPSAVVLTGSATAVVTFDLDKAANVELTVTRLSNGRVLRRIVRAAVPAGAGNRIVWDGRADNGILADSGDYRLALVATDSTGSQSLVRYALIRVMY
jgi:hypothetical protein